jgi:hypothetical protein
LRSWTKDFGMPQATLETATLEEAQPAEVSAAASTADELLSKMAGEEVDRLLAETEAVRSAPAAAEAPVEHAVAVAEVDSALASQIDDLLVGMDDAGTEVAVHSAAAPRTGTIKTPVEPLPAEKVATPVEPPVVSKIEPPAPVAAPVAAPPAAPVAASEEARLEVLAAELEVDKPAPAPAPVATPPAPAAVAAAPVIVKPSAAALDAGFLVRLLIRFNAPLSGCSNAFRSAFGTVAIVNVVVAVALIVYAVMSRQPR